MTQSAKSNPNCNNCTKTVKFLYSYGGHILPRRSDGKLRYVGGDTRVLSVGRAVTFAELLVKFGELCGASMILKCKLPNEDLDVLISIKSDEELRCLISEYDRVSEAAQQELKVRAVLFPAQSLKKVSPPSSPLLSFTPRAKCLPPRSFRPSPPPPPPSHQRDLMRGRAAYPGGGARSDARCYPHGSPRHRCLVPHSNYCQ